MKRLPLRAWSAVQTSFVGRVVRRFLACNCTMHAAGLTYFSLLAVVPVLCCILVAAKACRVDEYARGQLNARIDALIVEIERAPDGELPLLAAADEEARRAKRLAASEFAREARAVSNDLFARVESFDVGMFGWIGFGFLLWTVISSLASVETSFNEIFCVARARPVWKRAYLYLFILVVLPVLATVAMSLPILRTVEDVLTWTMGRLWVTKWMSDGLIGLLDSRLFGFTFTLGAASLAFGFFFWVVPNCAVRFRCAGLGGLVTAVLFGGWLKLCAVAQVGIAKSSALYGSFAFLPIVLAWLYMSWQIVLLGACLVRELALRSGPLPKAGGLCGRSGFTLVEMLLATLLVGVLTALSVMTFQSVSRGWQVSTDYLDKMQRTDYALDQVIAGLRSMYYPHDGKQNADYGFVLEDRGSGEDPDRSDVITWSKTGPAIVGTKSALADTVHRVQVMVLEEGNSDYAEPIQKTGLYARLCGDAALIPKDGGDDTDYSFANDELYQPILVADGVTGFNCRVLATAEEGKAGATDGAGENEKRDFEDTFDASNAVPYKVELTFHIEKPDESFRSQTARAPMVRIVRIPIHEQSLDGALPPGGEETEKEGKGAKRK